jgi:hypothetical protein
MSRGPYAYPGSEEQERPAPLGAGRTAFVRPSEPVAWMQERAERRAALERALLALDAAKDTLNKAILSAYDSREAVNQALELVRVELGKAP